MSKSKSVLVVDDEEHIAVLLETNLELEGYTPFVAYNGKSALSIIEERHIDLVLLDVMLPDTSGLDLCRQIKRGRQHLPILMLSALGQSSDRINGLKSGADDYLGKPFNLTELFLRMENLLVRFQEDGSSGIQKIQLGEATVDFTNSTIIRNNETSILTPKEADLLRFLIDHPNKAIHRKDILDKVWGYEVYPTTRTIDNFIAKFRKWIELNPNDPKVIKTIRGVGYMLLK
ncbi:MAG: two-component system alkaline phosphatase synthesis response regulator PhoP [Saprospiraceae bacterium]|jgi:two-component system alkaline phosphatase synthesis response regulator PhoP